MNKKSVKIQLRTPVWTGNAEQVPDGLKLSGVLGSMRYMFEALVRMSESHTCDINTNKKQCNFEKDTKICPACALFGCTGLSRAFKINWNVPVISGGIVFPESDSIPLFRNRHANGEKYIGTTSIDTWLATAIKGERGTISPQDHNIARQILQSKVKPAFSAMPVPMDIILLRNIPGIDIFKLLAGLLTYMSDYYAIGAKVNQGWGFFEVFEDDRVELEDFQEELKKLIAMYPFNQNWDNGFLNADWIPFFEPIEISCAITDKRMNRGVLQQTDNFGLVWSGQMNPYSGNYAAAGFALQYRLRRILKFWQYDRTNDDPECYDDMMKQTDKWNDANKSAAGRYKPQHHVSWNKEGAFSEYLFGTSDGGDKHAGSIGVSHPYKIAGKWYVRLISQTKEWEDAEPFYYILKDQLTMDWN